jgi:hypothetical protein
MATCAATHAIPKEWISRLDPEWVTLWSEHGCHQLRADEVSVPQYRQDLYDPNPNPKHLDISIEIS